MAKLTAQEIAKLEKIVDLAEKQIDAAKNPERVKATAAVRRTNAILERRARKF